MCCPTAHCFVRLGFRQFRPIRRALEIYSSDRAIMFTKLRRLRFGCPRHSPVTSSVIRSPDLQRMYLSDISQVRCRSFPSDVKGTSPQVRSFGDPAPERRFARTAGNSEKLRGRNPIFPGARPENATLGPLEINLTTIAQRLAWAVAVNGSLGTLDAPQCHPGGFSNVANLVARRAG